jgi:dipeptidyl-peptidase-4
MKRIYFVFFGILFSVVMLAQESSKSLSLDVVFKSRALRAKGVYGLNTAADGQHYYRILRDTMFRYSYLTGNAAGYLIAGNELLTQKGDTLSLGDISFSENESKMLIASGTEAIYRHSSKSAYYVYDFKTKSLTALSDNGKQQLAEFSPDASKVAFVRDNNLFIKDLSSGAEIQITRDGLDRNIIYGTTDWVYEEEFSFTKGFEWAPDGKSIAFYRFDESKVKEFWMTTYGELYPENYKFKYPKAGEDNSLVTVHVYHLADARTVKMDIGAETDIYIPRIKWTRNSSLLSMQRLNRHQNKLEILIAEATNGKSDVVYTETNKYYIEITDDLYFMPDGKSFLLTSQKNGYNHIYLNKLDGSAATQLTKGSWEVDKILGFDPVSKRIYFNAAFSSPLNREICFVDLKARMKIIAGQEGTNSAAFSSTFQYFIKTWSDSNTPSVYSVCDANGKVIRVIEDNAAFIPKMKEYGLLKRDFFNFRTSEGVELNGWMIKPPAFDPNKKYPVLVYLYGGPGSQTVTNSWAGGQLWYQMLAQKGIVVVSVDNRGTGFRGEEFRKMTYQQLGKYETEDQIELAKYLITQGIADPKKIGIFGWSYGGYMSSLCMTKGADYYSVGIAVAPVTNWRYYDNIYTERYMRTPQENPKGYDDNSPINHVEKLTGKYLLVHGTADDNVHFQNTVEMVSALVKENKPFQTMYYPNSNHGIYTGPNTTFHLYTMMTNFLLENLLSK